jgi:folate-binding protein YgfZ
MKSPLEEAARRRGATFETRLGVVVPAEFAGVEREWRAAREGCAVYDAGIRAWTAAAGADRVSFLQGMLSNDVQTLAAGSGMHALVLTQAAKVVTQVRVHADAERIVLDAPAWHAPLLRETLERYIVADDVELSALADPAPLLGLEGPFAAALLGEVLGETRLPAEPLAHAPSAYQGRALRIVRVSEVKGDGFLLCGAAATAAPLLDACIEAGAVPMGLRALEVLRVENGVPWAGVDMDDTVLAPEMPLDDAISRSKGCYLGQEVVERVNARGHVNRRLAGLVIEGEHVPATPAPVRAGDAPAGTVTSAVRSPLLARVVALAIVHRRFWEPGTRVEVEVDGGSLAASVVPLPFRGQGT